MTTVTLTHNDYAITIYIHNNGIADTIMTDLDGAVDIYDQLLDLLEGGCKADAVIRINRSDRKLKFAECYHLYKTLDALMDDLFELAVADDLIEQAHHHLH